MYTSAKWHICSKLVAVRLSAAGHLKTVCYLGLYGPIYFREGGCICVGNRFCGKGAGKNQFGAGKAVINIG